MSAWISEVVSVDHERRRDRHGWIFMPHRFADAAGAWRDAFVARLGPNERLVTNDASVPSSPTLAADALVSATIRFRHRVRVRQPHVSHAITERAGNVRDVVLSQKRAKRKTRELACLLRRVRGSMFIARPIASSSGARRGSKALGFGCFSRTAAAHSSGDARRNGAEPVHAFFHQQNRDREDVGRRSELPAVDLFGRHVSWRAEDFFCLLTSAGAAMPKSMSLI